MPCVENNLRRAHQSSRCVLVSDVGRQMGFAAPSVGLARVDYKTLDVEDDGLLGPVENDRRADWGARIVPLKLARVVDIPLWGARPLPIRGGLAPRRTSVARRPPTVRCRSPST